MKAFLLILTKLFLFLLLLSCNRKIIITKNDFIWIKKMKGIENMYVSNDTIITGSPNYNVYGYRDSIEFFSDFKIYRKLLRDDSLNQTIVISENNSHYKPQRIFDTGYILNKIGLIYFNPIWRHVIYRSGYWRLEDRFGKVYKLNFNEVLYLERVYPYLKDKLILAFSTKNAKDPSILAEHEYYFGAIDLKNILYLR